MPSIFRDPVPMIFIDEDNNELRRVASTEIVPRVGENVRIGKIPHVVERIGYDVPAAEIESVWIVLRPV